MEKKYGEIAFLLGVIISLIIGLFSSQLGANQPLVYGVLAVLGLIVGLLNIKDREINSFLIASLALLLPSSALRTVTDSITQAVPAAGTLVIWITSFLAALAVFVAPAMVIVALKSVYNLAMKK